MQATTLLSTSGGDSVFSNSFPMHVYAGNAYWCVYVRRVTKTIIIGIRKELPSLFRVYIYSISYRKRHPKRTAHVRACHLREEPLTFVGVCVCPAGGTHLR